MWATGLYQPTAWLLVFAASFALVVRFAGRDAAPGGPDAGQVRVQVAALLAVQLACIAPLFVLGVDYGRWLFLWLAGSVMLHSAGRAAPGWAEAAVARAFAVFRLDRLLPRVPAPDWVFLFFGAPVCWSLQGFLLASPAGRWLHLLRSWL
jgi:hypothetical protein